MSGVRRAAALLSVALAAGSWSVHAESPAAAPQVQIGDTWKYRNVDGFTREPQSEYSHTVVDVNERKSPPNCATARATRRRCVISTATRSA